VKRRGRPSLPLGTAALHVVSCKVSEDELAAIQQAAEDEGETVSEWAREALGEKATEAAATKGRKAKS